MGSTVGGVREVVGGEPTPHSIFVSHDCRDLFSSFSEKWMAYFRSSASLSPSASASTSLHQCYSLLLVCISKRRRLLYFFFFLFIFLFKFVLLFIVVVCNCIYKVCHLLPGDCESGPCCSILDSTRRFMTRSTLIQ